MGFIYFTGANFLLTMAAAVLCVCFAPTAAGPGIPEIKAYLNGVDTPNMFGAATLIVKVRWHFFTYYGLYSFYDGLHAKTEKLIWEEGFWWVFFIYHYLFIYYYYYRNTWLAPDTNLFQ
jgi:hypothetical protein